MKHLKLTAHQPSPKIKDKKKLFQDYRRCYTCDLEVDGYWNLMNHRKTEHPSNKKCRNFPDGNYTFGKDCWYVHAEELMDVDESFKQDEQKHKCYICHIEFETKDRFKKHKKLEHPLNVQRCKKFISKKCDRREEQCWYIHDSAESCSSPKSKSPVKKSQVFCEAPADPLPPDQFQKMMDAVDSLCKKVQHMEKRFKDLMN